MTVFIWLLLSDYFKTICVVTIRYHNYEIYLERLSVGVYLFDLAVVYMDSIHPPYGDFSAICGN